MFFERVVPDRSLFGDPPLRITSVGALVYTGELERRGWPSFLLLEQTDQPDKPWGIPAGSVEDFETEPQQAIIREVREETGMDIDPRRLQEFLYIQEGDIIRIVYAYQARWAELHQIGEWEFCHVPKERSRSYFYQRVKDGTKKISSDEIGDIILLPHDDLFSRGHPLVHLYYRWDSMHHIKARLEGLRVI